MIELSKASYVSCKEMYGFLGRNHLFFFVQPPFFFIRFSGGAAALKNN